MSSDTSEVITSVTETARPKRHVFRWVYLFAQAVFLLWVIVGAVSTSHPHINNCQGYVQACAEGYQAGRAIGVGLVIAMWVAFDIIVGGAYLIFRLTQKAGK